MIKSELGTIEINGCLTDVISDYGMISEGLIKSVPEDMWWRVAYMLTEMLRLAIENTLKGGGENEKSKQST